MNKIVDSKVPGMLKSHAQRIAEPDLVYPKVLSADYEVRGSEDFVENGRIVKRSFVVTIHPQDMFKDLNAFDYALENVISLGALSTLKEGKLSTNTLSELSDSLEGTIDDVVAAVDLAEFENTVNVDNVEPNKND